MPFRHITGKYIFVPYLKSHYDTQLEVLEEKLTKKELENAKNDIFPLLFSELENTEGIVGYYNYLKEDKVTILDNFSSNELTNDQLKKIFNEFVSTGTIGPSSIDIYVNTGEIIESRFYVIFENKHRKEIEYIMTDLTYEEEHTILSTEKYEFEDNSEPNTKLILEYADVIQYYPERY